MRSSYRALYLAASAAAICVSMPAFADAPADTNNGGAANDGEIVVTAQRREEKLMDVPLAIQAATGDQLQASGIKQITDLQFTTPGYNVSDSNGYTQVFIRGVGNAEFVGADPSVATFIDDVPRVYGSMVNNFIDVERVEVLKGAQGGLYGRNATGGVINIITKQPSTERIKADGRISYGEHNTFEVAGYVNVPLGDKMAFSIAGDRRSSDPYFKNLAPAAPYTAAMFSTGLTFLGMNPAQSAAFFNSGQRHNDVGNQDFWAVDGKLLFRPSDNFKITIAGDYSSKDDSQGNAQIQVAPAYEQAQFLGLFGFLVGELGGVANPSAFPANFLQGSPPKFRVSNGTPGFVKLEDWGVSATAVLSTDSVDFTSITAYRKQHTSFIDDLGASSFAFTAANVDNHKHYFYQELRAVSHLSGPFQFIVGGSYLKNYFQGFTNLQLFGVLTSPLARSVDRVENWSVYAQASYELTDRLTLTASGRYIHEKNTAQFYDLGANPDPNSTFTSPAGLPVSATESKFLPAATLSYKLEGGGNVYFRWARGFKSGGVNPVANASNFVVAGTYYSTAGSIFKGETVDTFEVGLKTPLFNNQVQLTLAAFYNSYKNLQTAGHVTGNINPDNGHRYSDDIILTIINAPSARTYGIEGTLNWHVTPTLNFAMNAGYLNAKYKDFKISAVGPVGSRITEAYDLSGQQMINAPEFQFSAALNLDQPITDRLNLTANLLASYTSKVNYQVTGKACATGEVVGVDCLPDAIGPSYWIVNARLGIKTNDERFGLAVFANNLFNEAYYTYGNSNAANTTQFTWGNPRIVGVEATFKY